MGPGIPLITRRRLKGILVLNFSCLDGMSPRSKVSRRPPINGWRTRRRVVDVRVAEPAPGSDPAVVTPSLLGNAVDVRLWSGEDVAE